MDAKPTPCGSYAPTNTCPDESCSNTNDNNDRNEDTNRNQINQLHHFKQSNTANKSHKHNTMNDPSTIQHTPPPAPTYAPITKANIAPLTSHQHPIKTPAPNVTRQKIKTHNTNNSHSKHNQKQKPKQNSDQSNTNKNKSILSHRINNNQTKNMQAMIQQQEQPNNPPKNDVSTPPRTNPEISNQQHQDNEPNTNNPNASDRTRPNPTANNKRKRPRSTINSATNDKSHPSTASSSALATQQQHTPITGDAATAQQSPSIPPKKRQKQRRYSRKSPIRHQPAAPPQSPPSLRITPPANAGQSDDDDVDFNIDLGSSANNPNDMLNTSPALDQYHCTICNNTFRITEHGWKDGAIKPYLVSFTCRQCVTSVKQATQSQTTTKSNYNKRRIKPKHTTFCCKERCPRARQPFDNKHVTNPGKHNMLDVIPTTSIPTYYPTTNMLKPRM